MAVALVAYVEPTAIHPPFTLTFRRIDRVARCRGYCSILPGPAGEQLYCSESRRLIERDAFIRLDRPSVGYLRRRSNVLSPRFRFVARCHDKRKETETTRLAVYDSAPL